MTIEEKQAIEKEIGISMPFISNYENISKEKYRNILNLFKEKRVFDEEEEETPCHANHL